MSVLLAVGGLGLADGGYGPMVWGLAALGLLWLLAIALVLTRRVHLGVLDAVALAGLAGTLGWTGLSVLWSLDPAQSVVELQRGLVPLAGFAALLLVSRGVIGSALAGLCAACTFTSVVALTSWLSAGAPSAAGISAPVGYANALGLLAAMGLLLAVGFACRATAARGVRLLAGGAAVVQAVTLYLSASRGAVAALAIGIAVCLLLGGARRRVVVTTLAGVGLTGLLLVAAAGVVAPARASAEMATVTATREGGGASSVSVQPRLRYWAVAWDSARDAPLLGTGAGTFARTWLEHRPVPAPARNAHNLYLETLAELGIVGLALLIAALAAPCAAAVRARTHPFAPEAAGAYAAFLAHAGIDVDWEMPVLTVAALLCAGALLMMARGPDTERRLGTAVRTGALGAVIALAAFTYAGVSGNTALERSREAVKVGALETASVNARAALRWAPWSGEAWRVLGEEALARGDGDLARIRFDRGLDRDPHSWWLWAGQARASHGAARRDAAQRAAALNPLGNG